MKPQLHIVDDLRFRTAPFPCSYIPGQVARLDYRVITSLTATDYERLLERGWRRFGIEFFRPACARCSSCQSLRVDVARFQPARRHRRIIARNRDVRVVIQRPTVTGDHLALYNDYHRFMHAHRGWPLRTISASEYMQSFVSGHWDFAREFLFYERDQLVGVGLADVLPTALSSVYFFHDPERRQSGPGVFSVLQQWEYARKHRLSYQYLGYWIRECPSMTYKSQYWPHQILSRWAADDEEPSWIDAPREDS